VEVVTQKTAKKNDRDIADKQTKQTDINMSLFKRAGVSVGGTVRVFLRKYISIKMQKMMFF